MNQENFQLRPIEWHVAQEMVAQVRYGLVFGEYQQEATDFIVNRRTAKKTIATIEEQIKRTRKASQEDIDNLVNAMIQRDVSEEARKKVYGKYGQKLRAFKRVQKLARNLYQLQALEKVPVTEDSEIDWEYFSKAAGIFSAKKPSKAKSKSKSNRRKVKVTAK